MVWISFAFLLSYFCLHETSAAADLSYITRACTVYCSGNLLEQIQLAHIFNDSKTFVDMPMRQDPEDILAAFNELTDMTKPALAAFVNEYFFTAGSDVDSFIPTDFDSSPPLLENIVDDSMRTWASDLNQLWLLLGKQVNESVQENPQRHSFVPRK